MDAAVEEVCFKKCNANSHFQAAHAQLSVTRRRVNSMAQINSDLVSHLNVARSSVSSNQQQMAAIANKSVSTSKMPALVELASRPSSAAKIRRSLPVTDDVKSASRPSSAAKIASVGKPDDVRNSTRALSATTRRAPKPGSEGVLLQTLASTP